MRYDDIEEDEAEIDYLLNALSLDEQRTLGISSELIKNNENRLAAEISNAKAYELVKGAIYQIPSIIDSAKFGMKHISV